MVEKLLYLGIGFVAIILFWMILRKIFRSIYKKKNVIYLKFLNSIINVILIIAYIYFALSLFQVTKEVSKVLLQSGTLIIAIATFAAQQALGNVISGFSISLTKPFDVNEKVKVLNGSNVVAEGIITDITIRHTIIRTFDGQSAIIPNGIMDSSVIINTNYTENVGNFLEIEVSFDSDIELARKIVKDCCIAHTLTINDESTVVSASAFTPDGVKLKTTVWTKTLDENFKACSDLRLKILEEFKKNGIVIPYQTITIDKK